MITFSRKKAAAHLSFRPSLPTVAASISIKVRPACSRWQRHQSNCTLQQLTFEQCLQENTAEHGAEQSLCHSFNPKVDSHREERADDPADMAHAQQGKVPKSIHSSYRSEDLQQQPDAPVVKTRGHTAPPHMLPVVPSGQKHANGRYLPPAPTTASQSLAQKPQQGPRTSATPLTDPDTWSGSTEPEMSSGVSASGTMVSSDDDASSYAPSSRGQASPDSGGRGLTADTGGRGLTVARPPLHPKPVSKHGHNTVLQQTNTPWVSDDAAKPGNHKSKTAPILQVCC